ncbi:MAG: hypothetical protein KGL93_07365 [Gemmatimonadota bacterium]|nr:hypothetical protein [Gemmatimonadota bacterium]
MKSFRIAIAFGLLWAVAAQGQRPKSASKVVPPNLRPPAGMCRIWLDGVPPGRQPAPTDCASALRNRPAKGEVIFGDDFAHADSGSQRDDARAGNSPLRGLAPMPEGMDVKTADSAATGRRPDESRKRGEAPKADGRKAGGHKPDSTAFDVRIPPGATD